MKTYQEMTDKELIELYQTKHDGMAKEEYLSRHVNKATWIILILGLIGVILLLLLLMG